MNMMHNIMKLLCSTTIIVLINRIKLKHQ